MARNCRPIPDEVPDLQLESITPCAANATFVIFGGQYLRFTRRIYRPRSLWSSLGFTCRAHALRRGDEQLGRNTGHQDSGLPVSISDRPGQTPQTEARWHFLQGLAVAALMSRTVAASDFKASRRGVSRRLFAGAGPSTQGLRFPFEVDMEGCAGCSASEYKLAAGVAPVQGPKI